MIDLQRCVLGIELGSTRIKAVLIDEAHNPIASGSYSWENRLENGVWVYSLEDAVAGVRSCYKNLKEDIQQKFGQQLRRVAAIGISGMMHGYLVLDKELKQIAPFRTWRNTITQPAARELTELFQFNIPQRWSIAHLYQAMLNKESHVGDISLLTTLSGYIHLLLTGRNCMGISEASGMFPYDTATGDWDCACVEKFDKLAEAYQLPWQLRDILPNIVPAGTQAGALTAAGAALLDESGTLEAGIPFCSPEGDAGTGLVATGAVLPRTGSVSAGTSAFALLVLDKPLKGYYPEIDVSNTPTGKIIAQAHTNNCTSEIDTWLNLFADTAKVMGWDVDTNELYSRLFRKAMEANADCDGIVAYNYLASEPLAGTEAGRPMVVRLPESKMSIANFMRSQLNGAIATLKLGMDLLAEREHIETDRLLAHGGYFKTPGVGQQILADALNVPITAMETAGEGGPWGMALMAAYMAYQAPGETLEDYLMTRVFSNAKSISLEPQPEGVSGFQRYLHRYKDGLDAENAAAKIQ